MTSITIIVDVAVAQIITITVAKITETIVVAAAVAVASRVAAVSHVVVVVIITTITTTTVACITIAACITFITLPMNVLAHVHNLAAVDAHKVVAVDVHSLVTAVVDVVAEVWAHSVRVALHPVVVG